MEFLQTLGALVVGSLLTVLGAYLASRRDAQLRKREKTEANLAAWNDECIELLADFDIILDALRRRIITERIDPAGAEVAIKHWHQHLRRPVKRVSIGHPVPTVRERAREVETLVAQALVNLGSTKPDEARSALEATMNGFWALRQAAFPDGQPRPPAITPTMDATMKFGLGLPKRLAEETTTDA